MAEPMTYARYLALDQLLSAQNPVSATHDETLFIIVHQTKELWLKQVIAVLATMTPSDYTSFREGLGPSSGFQSDQFRTVEYLLGLKDGKHIAIQEGRPEVQAAMREALAEPSLWDVTNAALHGRRFPLPAHVLTRDWRQPYMPGAAAEEAWTQVYRDTYQWWDLYQLAEKLLDIDDALATRSRA